MGGVVDMGGVASAVNGGMDLFGGLVSGGGAMLGSLLNGGIGGFGGSPCRVCCVPGFGGGLGFGASFSFLGGFRMGRKVGGKRTGRMATDKKKEATLSKQQCKALFK